MCSAAAAAAAAAVACAVAWLMTQDRLQWIPLSRGADLGVQQVLDRAAALSTASGRRVRSSILYKDPTVQVVQIDDFLSVQQCDELIAVVRRVLGAEHQVAASPWALHHQPTAWTRRCMDDCAMDSAVQVLDLLLEELTLLPRAHFEEYQLLHYEMGQEYTEHHDFIHAQSHLPQGEDSGAPTNELGPGCRCAGIHCPAVPQ